MARSVGAGGSRFVWHGPAVSKQIKLTAKKKLMLAAEAVSNQVKRNISVGRPASKPGQMPHVDTGNLRGSIFWKPISDTKVIVGTPLKYGLWLEIGRGPIVAKPGKTLHFKIDGKDIFVKRVKAMAPRPYLRPTLASMRGKIERIFSM